jgi:pilus assembly protein TadC
MAQTKKIKKEEGGFDWQETLSGLGVGFFKNFADSLADKIKHRIQEMVLALQKGLLGTFLIVIGTIFALISLVLFINEMLVMSNGVGYAVVGIFSILVGLLIIKSK